MLRYPRCDLIVVVDHCPTVRSCEGSMGGGFYTVLYRVPGVYFGVVVQAVLKYASSPSLPSVGRKYALDSKNCPASCDGIILYLGFQRGSMVPALKYGP